jgi:hypothetical protein
MGKLLYPPQSAVWHHGLNASRLEYLPVPDAPRAVGM